MFGFLKRAARRRLSFEQLQILVLVAQQVVLSVEGTLQMPGTSKKAVAMELVAQILKEMGLVAPESLVDTVIESAVKIPKTLDQKVESEVKPRFSLDITGRPKTGN